MRMLSGFLATGAAAAALSLMPSSVQAQQGRADTTLSCAGAVLHFTARGFAFECVDQRGEAKHIVVVRDDNFAGRRDHVIDVLRELNGRSSTGTGRQRSIKGLWVSYRRADNSAQAICNSVVPRYTGGRCVIGGDIAFR